MAQRGPDGARIHEERRKFQTETYPDMTIAKLYPDIDWATPLKDPRHVVSLCAACSATAEDELAYKELLMKAVERLCPAFNTVLRSPVLCSKAKAEQLRSTLETTIANFSSYFSDLKLGFVSKGSEQEGPFADDERLQWQLTSGEVEAFVSRADGLLGSIHNLEEEFWLRPGEPHPARAPPDLFIYKLRTLQNKLHLTPKLSPTLDTKEIINWFHHCDTHHADHCNQSAQSRQIFARRPKWLIDVHRLCLVPADTDQRYIALSYVWGPRGAAFKTKKHTLARLQQEGSLDSKTLRLSNTMAYPIRDTDYDVWSLPRTIRDSITFTDRIGENYLWVDSLCIVQDDEDEKREHLQNMGSIYANACFTLVAAEGTAFSGLRGLTSNVNDGFARHRGSEDYKRYPTSLHRELRAHHERMQSSLWNQRGWTFQEQIFSRRLLVWSGTGVVWECHCAVWMEGIPLDEKAECQANGGADVVAPGFHVSSTPSLEDYARHITQYNGRELTYPEDGLDGISGVLGVLSTVFKGSFVAGLPVMFFDEALLWSNEAGLQRRRAKLESGWEKLAPSWSWAAWKGIIRPREIADREVVQLRTLVEWKYATRTDEKWRPLPVTSAQEPKPTEQDDHLLPLPPMFTARSPSYLLYCRARTAVFNVVDLDIGADPRIHLRVVNDSGEGVGILTACETLPRTLSTSNSTTLPSLPPPLMEKPAEQTEDNGSSPAERVTVELLAISESLPATVTEGGEGEAVPLYIVLWIERDGDIVTRKGVGSVLKEAFEEKQGQRTELVLG